VNDASRHKTGSAGTLARRPDERSTTALTEKEWQRQVVELARLCGYLVYHTHLSKNSQPGFPDLTCVRDRVVFLELKTEMGKLSEAQAGWIDALTKAGALVMVARPSDLQAVADLLTNPSVKAAA
jgi:hypothetical protein